MGGAVPPLHNTPSWRGAQREYRDNFTLLIIFGEALVLRRPTFFNPVEP
jgi:hypothetical protein